MHAERKKKDASIIFMIVIPIILSIVMAAFLGVNHYDNSRLRVAHLTAEHFDGDVYNFGDVSAKITVRGGDGGSWLKDPIYDDDGNMLYGAFVGTIYEALIYNNSKDTVSDWTLRVPINEPMWLNNNWNSKMEVHQHAKGDEKVLAIDLSDYSEYDINLDYYIDHTGPMIPLDVDDYFIYLPEKIAEEKPIAPAQTGEVGEACARFGFIMYIPDQPVDYEADFSGAKLEYYMYSNPIKKSWFWTIVVLFFVWFVWTVVHVMVSVKTRNIIKQQQEQKRHNQKMIRQTMQLVVNMIENKDPSTKGHSVRVAEYSRLIAQEMGYDEDACQEVFYIGLMHDCGKLNIPDEILKNPGRLSPDEYEVMKKHTVYGGEILKSFTSIEGIDVGAKFHHERYDGKGYPSGLANQDIPQIARIIGVADAFDAMNSKRCYRENLPEEVIMRELTENREKQFDPECVDILLRLLENGKIIIGEEN